MTREELDLCGFALVIARSSLIQLSMVAKALQMPPLMQEHINAMELLQAKIKSGAITADDEPC